MANSNGNAYTECSYFSLLASAAVKTPSLGSGPLWSDAEGTLLSFVWLLGREFKPGLTTETQHVLFNPFSANQKNGLCGERIS